MYKKNSGLLGGFNRRKFYLLDGMLLYSKVILYYYLHTGVLTRKQGNKASGLIYLDGITIERIEMKKRYPTITSKSVYYFLDGRSDMASN